MSFSQIMIGVNVSYPVSAYEFVLHRLEVRVSRWMRDGLKICL
jgi:hypothetical protein